MFNYDPFYGLDEEQLIKYLIHLERRIRQLEQAQGDESRGMDAQWTGHDTGIPELREF